MSERTRRPPGDGASETLAGRERESSPDAPLSVTTSHASALDARPQATSQAETAQRMGNSPHISAQRKTRDAMANSAGAASLRKTAQGMQHSTAQRLVSRPYEATMADTMAAPADVHTLATTPGNAPDSHPSTVSVAAGAPIQRRLMVEGMPGRRKALFRLLGGPAGLTFNWDEKTKLVTADAVDGDVASPALRTALRTIIDDKTKTAKVNVSSDQELTIGGFYETQEIDVTQLVDVEKSAKGAGVAMAIHEIWENYMAQGAGKDGGLGEYQPAHDSATRTESAVATEVSGIGSDRVADSGEGKYAVFDYSSYYLVLDTDDYTAVRAPRRTVGAYHLRDYENNAVTNTGGDGSLVGIAKNDLSFNPMATARVVGFRRAGEAPGLGLQRARAVIAEMKQGLKDDAARERENRRRRQEQAEREEEERRAAEEAEMRTHDPLGHAGDSKAGEEPGPHRAAAGLGDNKMAGSAEHDDASGSDEDEVRVEDARHDEGAGHDAEGDDDGDEPEDGEEEDEDEHEQDRCYAVDGGVAAGVFVQITVTAPDGVFPQDQEEDDDT